MIIILKSIIAKNMPIVSILEKEKFLKIKLCLPFFKKRSGEKCLFYLKICLIPSI